MVLLSCASVAVLPNTRSSSRRPVTSRCLRHPGVAELDRHVANAVAKPTPRGWRLVKSAEGAQIDALIALAMAAERATQPVHAVKFHGFV
jgi:hypothetical protein